MSTDRTSLIRIADRIPLLTTAAIASASPDYVRQTPVRILSYRAPTRPGIGLRIRYTQDPPTAQSGGTFGVFWNNAPIHGNSYLLSRPWSRRIETRISVGIGSSTLDYVTTDTEIAIWIPGDSVSVDCSLTHHCRHHRETVVPVPTGALRTDPRNPAALIATIPDVVASASAWDSPVSCADSDIHYADTIHLSAAASATPLSIIPPWARYVDVYPSQTGTGVNWTVSFLWPYFTPPVGQGLLSTLQQTSTTHYSARDIPIPPGAVFCAVSGITFAVQDWTFVYRGKP